MASGNRTGYVHQMLDKKLDFRNFTLECARDFGAYVSLRDEPLGTPTPKSIPEDTYHKKEYAKAVKALAEWKKLPKKEKESEVKSQISEHISYAKKAMKEDEEGNQKIRAMIEQVALWNPPTPEHTNLKDFMIEQLTTSLGKSGYYEKEISRLSSIKVKEMIKNHEELLQWNIDYHKKEMAKEAKRNEERNTWIKKLFESLEKK